jgi:hypothetical protein
MSSSEASNNIWSLLETINKEKALLETQSLLKTMNNAKLPLASIPSIEAFNDLNRHLWASQKILDETKDNNINQQLCKVSRSVFIMEHFLNYIGMQNLCDSTKHTDFVNRVHQLTLDYIKGLKEAVELEVTKS